MSSSKRKRSRAPRMIGFATVFTILFGFALGSASAAESVADEIDEGPRSHLALPVHTVNSDGSLGTYLGDAYAITATAAIFEVPDELPRSPKPTRTKLGEIPRTTGLAIINRDRTVVPVIDIHRVDGDDDEVALEVEDEVFDTMVDGEGRSFWCRFFPRMRGC